MGEACRQQRRSRSWWGSKPSFAERLRIAWQSIAATHPIAVTHPIGARRLVFRRKRRRRRRRQRRRRQRRRRTRVFYFRQAKRCIFAPLLDGTIARASCWMAQLHGMREADQSLMARVP
jgi:hypothetical protein